MSKEKNFTIGEFAHLFGISKQTLFYYEKNDIFLPKIIATNSYRYYTMEQYYIFEIILTLRKLGIPLKTIKCYVANRSSHELEKLIDEKILEYDLQIELLKQNMHNLSKRSERLKLTDKILKKTFYIEKCLKEYYVSTPLDSNKTMKEQIAIVAEHNAPFTTNEIFTEHINGYIFTQENFTKGTISFADYIYTKINYAEEYSHSRIKPQGKYAILLTPNAGHQKYKLLIKDLLVFIRENNLTVIGDCYISQLRNYWTTSK
ncbi:MAG: MerR family transcriptional regulator, partial [Acidaminococcaceae bacterium]|nr:MerR family transcriptional regulator [Acidaminococcaceae bacterium]